MKIRATLLVYSILVFWGNCSIPRNVIQKGFLIYRMGQYDSISRNYNRPMFPDIKVWYNSKLVIQEVYSIITKSDTLGRTTVSKVVEYYLFIDKESNSFYHYSSFSDTARILASYKQSDTAMLTRQGGWQFYGNANNIEYSSLSYLSDTVIGHINYKRIEFIELTNGLEINTIGYLRCDLKGTMFQIGKNITRLTGCPMVKYEQKASPGMLYPTSDEIIFERNLLTEKELQIFESWKMNETKFPIHNK